MQQWVKWIAYKNILKRKEGFNSVFIVALEIFHYGLQQ
jgi:hypothetical protein